MAKINTDRMHKIYYQALKHLGQNVTERQRTSTYKKLWQALREDYRAKGETPPNVYKVAKEYTEHDYEKTPRDENMNTAPAENPMDEAKAKEVINAFNQKIDDIYNDTYEWIRNGTRKGVEHDEGHYPSIAKYRIKELDNAYWELKNQLRQMEQDIPNTVLAQAIADNKELDYTIAIVELSTSDIEVEFTQTLEHLVGIEKQINKRADELANEEIERIIGK